MNTVPRMSRRAFLRAAALAGVGVAVACAPKATPVPPTSIPATAAATEPAPTTAPTASKGGGKLTYAELGDFNSFNPWRMSGANETVANLVFSRLAYKNIKGEMVPDLAESWQMAADGLSFTLRLRENVKWHDGKPCTANDFVTMFGYTKSTDERLSKDAGVQKIYGLLQAVADVKAPDAQTLVLTFPQPVPYIYDILDYWFAVRIDDPADAVLQKGVAIGTGPFKMVEWKPKEYTRYLRNPDYYLKDLPLLDEVMFKRFERSETLPANLQAGAIDGCTGISFADVAAIKADPNLSLLLGEATDVFDIIVNTNLAPLDKLEVRQAISYALNRADICKSVFNDVLKPTSSPFHSPASMAYREDLVNAYPFDLDKARQLLDKAGVKQADLKFCTGMSADWKLYGQIWQSDLKKIGINMTITEVETAQFYELAGKKDLGGNHLMPWGNGRCKRDPAILFQTQQQYWGGTRNPYGWVNEEYGKLIDDARVETDQEKRKTMYQRANEILVEQLPIIHLSTNGGFSVFSKKVKGVELDLLDYLIFSKAYLEG